MDSRLAERVPVDTRHRDESDERSGSFILGGVIVSGFLVAAVLVAVPVMVVAGNHAFARSNGSVLAALLAVVVVALLGLALALIAGVVTAAASAAFFALRSQWAILHPSVSRHAVHVETTVLGAIVAGAASSIALYVSGGPSIVCAVVPAAITAGIVWLALRRWELVAVDR